MHVIGDPGGEQRENWIQDIFGETVAKNFSKMLLVPQPFDFDVPHFIFFVFILFFIK